MHSAAEYITAANPARRWLILAGIVACYSVFNYLLPPSHGPEWRQMLTLGVVYVQPVLFGIWAGMGPMPAIKRWPLTLASLTSVVLVASVGNREWLAPEYIAILLAFFSVTAVVTWLVSWWKRLRICNMDEKRQRHTNQFSVRFMLIVTALSGLILAAGRILARDSELPNLDRWLQIDAEAIGILASVLLLTMPAAIAPSLILGAVPTRKTYLVFIAISALATVTATVTLAEFTGMNLSEYWTLGLMQIGTVLTSVLTSLAVRWAGYRLVRIG